jgi:hypothetical protein
MRSTVSGSLTNTTGVTNFSQPPGGLYSFAATIDATPRRLASSFIRWCDRRAGKDRAAGQDPPGARAQALRLSERQQSRQLLVV